MSEIIINKPWFILTMPSYDKNQELFDIMSKGYLDINKKSGIRNESIDLINKIWDDKYGLNNTEDILEEIKYKDISIIKNPYFISFYYYLTCYPLNYINKLLNIKLRANNKPKIIPNDIFVIESGCDQCNSKMVDYYPLSKNDISAYFGRIYERPHFGSYIYTSLCDTCKIQNDKLVSEKLKTYQEEKENEEYAKSLKIQKYITELRDMPYKEYLQTKHWQEIRKKALHRANYKCQLCSSKENLNVHHNTYENRGCEKEEDLIVLCQKCHGKFHDKFVEDKNYIEEDEDLIRFEESKRMDELLESVKDKSSYGCTSKIIVAGKEVKSL